MADDIFKEIDEEMRAQRWRAATRRFGAAGIALLLLTAVGAGFWQFQAYQDRQRDDRSASDFFAATQSGASKPGDHSVALLQQVVSRGPEGLRTLARLRLAQLAWDSGQKPQALAQWSAIQDDARTDQTLRGLGDLLWVQHQMEDGDPALLKSHLGPLSRPGNAWHAMARELDAELDLRMGRVADAQRKLAALSEDAEAPEGVRSRAGGLNDTLEATKTGG